MLVVKIRPRFVGSTNLGLCFNLHDNLNVVREGWLEAVWPVACRGLYR